LSSKEESYLNEFDDERANQVKAVSDEKLDFLIKSYNIYLLKEIDENVDEMF
jgi:hypothetical protein